MGFSYSKPEYCHQNHPHRTIEDAIECDRYTSQRLREDDQLRTMDSMLYGDRHNRYNAYPPNRQPNMPGQQPNGAGSYRNSRDGTTTFDRNQTRPGSQQNGTANYRDNREANFRAEAQPNRRDNFDQRAEHDREKNAGKKDKKKEGEPESRPGFLSRVFGTGDSYVCAHHHRHRSLEEANDCVRKMEERSREAHQQRMNEKLNRGERNGLHPDAQRNGPIIEEMD